MIKEPEEVLDKAYEAYQGGDYETSLTNFEWFFDNAVDIDSMWVGAKYMALREWYCLAEKFKPAFDALLTKRSAALMHFKENGDYWSFIDYAEISHVLKDDRELIILFKELRDKDFDLAKIIYPSIEKILSDNEEWALCSSFIDDCFDSYRKSLIKFDELMRISKEAYGGEFDSIYQKQFIQDIRNLIELLKSSKRFEEINMIKGKVKSDMLQRGFEDFQLYPK